MIASELVVTVRDKGRLIEAIGVARSSWQTYAPYLDSLYNTLRRAEVVSPQEVPPGVVTMNSQFELTDLRTEESRVYTLVYPEEVGTDETRLSVLSPSGVAFLGARVDDLIRWYDGERGRLSKVVAIRYQPEAAGNYHL